MTICCFLLIHVLLGQIAVRSVQASDSQFLRGENGRRSPPVQSIVNGVPTVGQEFPFFVQSTVASYPCGGALVAPDVVLSVAHCYGAFEFKTKRKVLVGAFESQNTSSGTAQFRLIRQAMRLHPNCSVGTLSYEFMLFKIEAVTLPNLKPVALNTNPNLPLIGENVTIPGFGLTDPATNNSYSNILMKANAAVITDEAGDNAYGRPHGTAEARARMYYQSIVNDQRTCVGDSGGPVLPSTNAPVLYGLHSFGGQSCDASFPMGAMRVSAAADWIQQTICELSDNPNPSCCLPVIDCVDKVAANVGCSATQTTVRKKAKLICCPKATSTYLDNVVASYRQSCL